MPKQKRVVVRHGDKRKSHEADSVERALRDVLREVQKGDVEFPFVLEFDGPSGAKYNISVDSVDAVQEVTTMGFMF